MNRPHIISINRRNYVTAFSADGTTFAWTTSPEKSEALEMSWMHAVRVCDFLKVGSGDHFEVLPNYVVVIHVADTDPAAPDFKAIHRDLLAMATAKAERFPQYRGHFDTWVLGRMNARQAGFKGGSVFEKGQWVLLRHNADPAFVTLHDLTLDYDVSVRATYVDVVRTGA